MRFAAIIILFSFFQIVNSHAQSRSAGANSQDAFTRLSNSSAGYEQITIHADSLIVENYYKHLLKNRQIKGIPGYRIRIFSESGVGAKDRQKRVRAKFLSLYKDVDAYYSYDGLNFKVYVGDCRTRSEAARLYERIYDDFPNAIIVKENINIDNIE